MPSRKQPPAPSWRLILARIEERVADLERHAGH